MDENDYFEKVYEIVRQIPPGKVVTYGQVAGLVQEATLTARMVGAAMWEVPAGVPWQRVIGAGGYLPIAKRSPELKLRQQQLLENEGVVFLDAEKGRVDMKQSQWNPNGEEEVLSLFDTED